MWLYRLVTQLVLLLLHTVWMYQGTYAKSVIQMSISVCLLVQSAGTARQHE